MHSRNHPSRPRHGWLYALPSARLPAQVRCAGRTYTLVHTYKHDFFAATGLYESAGQLAVLKIGRVTDCFGWPLDWIGRFLTNREVHALTVLAGTPGVPRLIGRVGRNGLLRVYVPGHPLERRERVAEEFFPRLESLLTRVHAAGMAYVDLNKRQNILVGEDGAPYLIDFQISFHPRRSFPGSRWLLRRLQSADRYHYLKHKRRLRPDQLTPEERRRVETLSPWIRLHRFFARPLTHLRRRALTRLDQTETAPVEGADAK